MSCNCPKFIDQIFHSAKIVHEKLIGKDYAKVTSLNKEGLNPKSTSICS